MPLIPIGFWPHITLEEMGSLTEQESDMLLYICNVWAPIKPPNSSETDKYPITLDIIRYTNKIAIIDRIKQIESQIKEESKEIYNGLKMKLKVE